MEKENNHGSGTATQRECSSCQRLPTEKVSTIRTYSQSGLRSLKNTTLPIAGAEQAAAAELREATKARKVERARRAQENSEDNEDNDDQGDGAQSVASSNVRQFIPSWISWRIAHASF